MPDVLTADELIILSSSEIYGMLSPEMRASVDYFNYLKNAIPGTPTLHLGQIDIERDAKRFNVINCGRRFGKDILCIKLAIDSLKAGKKVGWYQPTYKSLMEVWRALKRLLAHLITKGGVNVLDKRIEVKTGGIIEFWSLDGDPEASRGRDYDRVIINEAAKCRHLRMAWDLAIRPTLMDRRGDAWFPSTPRGRDAYFEFFQRGQLGTVEHEKTDDNGVKLFYDWKSWQKPTHENPHIPKEELEDAERTMPVTVYRQEILAEFLDVAGRFFDEWEPYRWVTYVDEKTGTIGQREEPWHVVEPFEIPAHWDVWAVGDPGTSTHARTHAVLLVAADPEGGLVYFDEIYESGKQSEEQAMLLLERLERWKRAYPVDPTRRDGLWQVNASAMPFDYANFFPPEGNSVVARAERTGKWPVEHYWEKGLPIVRAVKDRIAGWRAFKQLMHDTIPVKADSARLSNLNVTEREDDDGEDVRPKMRVFRGRCSNFIRTIPLMIRDERRPEDIEEDKLGVSDSEGHLEQHLVDCGRYSVMTRPQVFEAPTPETRQYVHGVQVRPLRELPPELQSDPEEYGVEYGYDDANAW